GERAGAAGRMCLLARPAYGDSGRSAAASLGGFPSGRAGRALATGNLLCWPSRSRNGALSWRRSRAGYRDRRARDYRRTDHDHRGLSAKPRARDRVAQLSTRDCKFLERAGRMRTGGESIMRNGARSDGAGLDPALLAVIANRLDSVCPEMTNTLLRSGRSAVLNMARDFSCSLVTGDNQLLASAEGLPVHVFGSQFLSEAMCNLHPDFAEGDAFLHNDVYLGNTHSADHTILVPVFVEGQHLFTCCAKAHQADCGNGLPTTYAPFAGDVYEEGALNFPCIRVQRNYKDIDDIIRMCRRRIRVPDQWYGDYLAMLGAARIGERRLKELTAKFGRPLILRFIKEWFDYSERRIAHVIATMPRGTIVGEGMHDPFGPAPDGIPIKVRITVDPDAGMIEADLTDNIDCLPAGLNESRTCALNNCMTGIFNSIDPDIPHNAGTFRRVRVNLRENCV